MKREFCPKRAYHFNNKANRSINTISLKEPGPGHKRTSNKKDNKNENEREREKKNKYLQSSDVGLQRV